MSNEGLRAPSWGLRIVEHAIAHPKRMFVLAVVATLAFAAAAPLVKVDTDPENMLASSEPVRVLHRELKERFQQHDMLVVGVVNEKHPDGVFNVDSLTHVYELTELARTLPRDDADGKVIAHDILSPSTVDDIIPLGEGRVQFDWLMSAPPKTREDALRIRDHAARNPFLSGTLLSPDRKALALYIPISSKDISYQVASELQERIKTFKGDDQFYISGLPVAEDRFGVEMFIQMAISAPAAMLLVFLVMLAFFRRVTVILAPMVVAMLSVLLTMGALVATGNTVHIMSSMIPIFIMPIAVLDSVHIVSELHDRYRDGVERAEITVTVMSELFRPMLLTSLTSAAGFASLALTPIPPVQVFGFFVALGIMVAWLFTVTLIPAWFVLLKPSTLAKFGHQAVPGDKPGGMSGFLQALGRVATRQTVPLVLLSLAATGAAIVGIKRIQINDNPVKWFAYDHELRQADRALNRHFAGTYMAYLGLEDRDAQAKPSIEAVTKSLETSIAAKAKALGQEDVGEAALEALAEARKSTTDVAAFAAKLRAVAESHEDDADSDEVADAWAEIGALIDAAASGTPGFKSPATLQYLETLQGEMERSGLVGKATSIADIVKVVNRDLHEGSPEFLKIPDTEAGVAQVLLTFESSHQPHTLWHFITRDSDAATVWVQLKSGDNRDMEALTHFLDDYVHGHPPPANIDFEWYGLTYINVVWQKKMVGGMTQAIIGSLVVIFVMMIWLLGSARWAVVSMIPLIITMLVIYGAVGLVGKDYDMPVAVLSSLTLGLAIDFSIHFLVRTESLYGRLGSWPKTAVAMFQEPARAIARNALVVAIGFLPLLLAPLNPYKTVGLLLATILLCSAIVTLLLLPALLGLGSGFLFPVLSRGGIGIGTLIVLGLSVAALVILTIERFVAIGEDATYAAAGAAFLLTFLIGLLYRAAASRKKGTP